MKRTMSIIVSLMLIITVFAATVSAGDENNPEITDYEKDVVGPRELIPLPRLIYPIFKNIDIISGWFSENQEQPDILSVSLKIKTFSYKTFFTVYTLWWSYNDLDYVAAFITHSKGSFQLGLAGYIDQNGTEVMNPVEYIVDQEKNILLFNIPKNMIGNPLAGEELTTPWIWTAARFQNELLSKFYSGELAKDYSDPYLGKTYTLQY